MAKLTALPSQAIIDGLKGKIDFYLWMGIPVARRWPRPPSLPRAPEVQAQWDTFSYASKLWQYLSPDIQAAYIETTHGTNLSGRDLAVKGYISGYFPT